MVKFTHNGSVAEWSSKDPSSFDDPKIFIEKFSTTDICLEIISIHSGFGKDYKSNHNCSISKGTIFDAASLLISFSKACEENYNNEIFSCAKTNEAFVGPIVFSYGKHEHRAQLPPLKYWGDGVSYSEEIERLVETFNKIIKN
jgi:hypothetical protein